MTTNTLANTRIADALQGVFSGPRVRDTSLRRDPKTGLTPRQAEFCWLWMFGPAGVRLNAAMCYARSFGWLDDVAESDARGLVEKHISGLTPQQMYRAQDYGNRLLQKPKIMQKIGQFQAELQQETSQSRASWLSKAIEMRDVAFLAGNYPAARSFHLDIGNALGHAKTNIEVTHTQDSGEILDELAQLIKEHPELAQLVGADNPALGLPVANTARKPDPVEAVAHGTSEAEDDKTA